jgi:hypothetical protein
VRLAAVIDVNHGRCVHEQCRGRCRGLPRGAARFPSAASPSEPRPIGGSAGRRSAGALSRQATAAETEGLGVLPGHVGASGDRREVAQGGVGSVVVVVVQPASQCCPSRLLGGVELLVGPLLQQGPVEPLDLAVGAWQAIGFCSR